jgi:hypothetical protein
MRLVAVTRVLNEDDIIEAFVRHHAPLLDHHLLLDNGSTDRTIEILRALKQEGARLTVLQNTSAAFAESHYNTVLFNIAGRNLQADWVVYLDCDEFLDERRVPGGLRARLAQMGPGNMCLELPLWNYSPMPDDDPSEPIIPRRVRKRSTEFAELGKLCIRGSLAGQGVLIGAGNHVAVWQGKMLAAQRAPDLPLAHYYRRSPWQQLTKIVIGRLKTLTGGRFTQDSGINTHYTQTFDTLRDDPAAVLLDPAFLAYSPSEESVVEDAIAYAGGALRYTPNTDPRMKAVSVIAAYAETLARQHGMLIDELPAMRAMVDKAASEWTQII